MKNAAIYCAAWALFGVGHAIWWCFDRKWCGGMHWPIYRAYDWFMQASENVQLRGDGRGPWDLSLPS